jgi:hypothetical protein
MATPVYKYVLWRWQPARRSKHIRTLLEISLQGWGKVKKTAREAAGLNIRARRRARLSAGTRLQVTCSAVGLLYCADEA